MRFLIIFTAQYVVFLVALIAIIALLLLKGKKRQQAFVFLIADGIVSLLLMKLSGHFILDPRPFVVEHVTPLIAHAADNGFPSDHTALSSLCTLVVFSYYRRLGIALAVLTVLIGTARVAAAIHHPLDIVGSVVIVLVATGIVWWALRKWKWFTEEKIVTN